MSSQTKLSSHTRSSTHADSTASSSARPNGAAMALAAAAILLVCASSAFAQVSQPDAAVVACGNSISSCGCTITKAGFYQVTADLDHSQGLTAMGGCIDIKASNVTLNTSKTICCSGFNITGPGGMSPSGIGIHILKSSRNDFLELPNAVNGWDVGILVEGSNNIVEDFSARFNGTAGVEVNGGNSNNVNDFSVDSNHNYGVWLRGASNNQVNCSNTNDNGTIGVCVGCSATGPISAACSPKVPAGKNNHIFDHTSDSNGHYGIAIDLGNTGNIVTDITSTGNPTFDMFDANPGCDSDLWFFATFGTASQSCIHH